MVDSDLNCHLLEINGSPGVAKRWLEPLVLSTIETVVAPRFPCGFAGQFAPVKARVAEATALDGESGRWMKVFPH